MGDMGWTQYEEQMEAAGVQACRGTALRNEHTIEEADNCDDGSVACPDCPFKPTSQVMNKSLQ